jgi:hypothetical protein
METITRFNPFPGLRSFEEDEDYLFFGREEQTDELLKKLGNTHFLAVIGTSGSGKSSLVKSGLLPFLHSGYMVNAGSSWNVAIARPGNDPIGNIARALSKPSVLYKDVDDSNQSMYSAIIESTLRRSTLGLAEAFKQSDISDHQNLLVVVDQFEELFRFNRYEKINQEGKRDSLHFINLLLKASQQRDVPIYVVFTMRSDFIGECTQFRGLPEAINEGQYLIPRMTREERKAAILGPVAVGGATMTPRLVSRLLNDVGDNPDQLPILQHSLMRTWDYWTAHSPEADPIDLPHYEAIGTMSRALSLHAEEAYNELSTDRERQLCEILFKSLTEKGASGQGIRRPCKLSEICAISNAKVEEFKPIIEIFRKPGISFLMPPSTIQIQDDTIIDISHESLMRVWTRLMRWVEEETQSAEIYLRLSEAAALYHEGKTDLWKDPELQLTLNWKEENQVNEIWANRYDPSYEAHQRALEEKQNRRKAVLKRTKIFAAVLGVAFLLSILTSIWAIDQRQEAIGQKTRADEQRRFAEEETARANKMADVANRKTTEANNNAAIARQEKEIALKQTIRANRLQKQANVLTEIAVKAKRNSDSLLIIATAETEKALILQEELKKTADNEKIQADIARNKEREAQIAKENAERLRMLEVGRSTALQAIRVDKTKDPELTAILAKTADKINRDYNGDPYDLNIFSALSHASYNLEDEIYNAHEEAVRALSISPYGKYFASGSDDGKILLWETNNTAKPLKSIALKVGKEKNIRSVIFAKESIIASTVDGVLVAWDRRELSKKYVILWQEKDPIRSIAINPSDGTIVAGNDRGQVLIWKNGDLTAVPDTITDLGKIFDISFNPKTNDIGIATEYNGVLILDAQGQNVGSLNYDEEKIYSLAFSSDGKHLAAGSSDGRILLWDLINPKYIPKFLNAHETGINALKFSPGNETLASAGADGIINLWAISSLSTEPRQLVGHNTYVWDIEFSPDGNFILSGGSDNNIRRWKINADQMADKLCSEIKRDLTMDEWERYVGADVDFIKVCKD